MNALKMIETCARHQQSDPLPESYDTRLEPMGWKAALGAGAVLIGSWLAVGVGAWAVWEVFFR